MKWKLFDISSADSMYKLPRKMGSSVDSENRRVYQFSYVTPLSRNVVKKRLPFGVVVVESGSNRVATVVLNSENSVENAASSMRQAVYELFSSTGDEIDADEREFLDLIDDQVVGSWLAR